MGLLSLFGLAGRGLKEALKKGAVIVDVRTGGEFDQGHVPGALNIPADRIVISAGRLKAMGRPIILCCNSGSRSNMAMQRLKESGLTDVYNGGSWQKVLRLVQRY